jgi:hypothetical protein
MLVSKEEHDGHRIVQLQKSVTCFTLAVGVTYFVHALEVWYFIQITDVDYRKVLDSVCDTVENLILSHTVRVRIASKADDDKAVLLAEDCLVDVPASSKMGKNNRAHGVRSSGMLSAKSLESKSCKVSVWGTSAL